MPFIQNSIAIFKQYKMLAEKAMEQISDDALFHQANERSNSIAIIIQHLSGNMLSRWTDFLDTDGEKVWRDRDQEFETVLKDRKELMAHWNQGWDCVFDSLSKLNETDLDKTVLIRTEPFSVMDAIQRQIAHYASHVGQIIYISKLYSTADWKSLSIPKGESKKFNQAMMEKK